MEFRIIVDSGCDLTPDLLESLDARRVPLVMSLGDDDYVDDDHLDVEHFIKKMNDYKGRAMSACPSPQSYCNEFSKSKMNFVVTLSSQLSGSYSSALIAKSIAQEDEINVHVFDSKSAAAGQLLIVLKLKEYIALNLSTQEIIDNVDCFIKSMNTLFVLENLDNLMKNGRMSKIVGKLATVMQIRPILGSDGEGNIASFAKAKGTRAAIEKLCHMIGEQCSDTKDKILVIAHCCNLDQALRLKKMAQEMYAFAQISITKTGGLASMYANEGGIIIAF